MFAQQPQRLEQEIAEVHRVERFQTGLIAFVESRALATRESCSLARRHAFRVDAPILPTIDEISERSRWPALVVQIFRLQELLEQAELVVGIEDGEIRPQAHQLGMEAQNLGADRVERSEPRHRLLRTGEDSNSLAHLPRGLIGEGHRQDLWRGRTGRNDVRDSGGQDASCPRRRRREWENRLLFIDLRPPAAVLRPTLRSVGGRVARARRTNGGALQRRSTASRSPEAWIFLRAATRIESCAGGRLGHPKRVSRASWRTPSLRDWEPDGGNVRPDKRV